MKTQNLLLKLLIVPAMVVVLAGSAQAATKTWAPSTTDFNLTTNWTGGLPTSADVATFTGAAGTQPNLTGNITTQSLFFSSAASSGYSLTRTAGSLTLNGTGADGSSFLDARNTSGTNTINAPIIIGYAAAQTARINQSGGGTLELLGDISSTNAITGLNITVGNLGGLTLSGNNTYQGTTRMSTSNGLLNINSVTAISSGALVIEANTNIDNKSASAITLTNNNAINLTGGNLIFVGTKDLSFGSGIVTMSGNNRQISTTSGNLTVGAINEDATPRSLTKTGAGTLVITGSSTYTGTTTVSFGTLLIDGNQSSAMGSVSVASNATLGGSGTIGGATSIADNGILAPGTIGDSTSTLSFNNKNLTLSGVNTKLNLDITGTIAGTFDKLSGINTFAMNGDITFTLTGSYGAASWDVADFTSKSGNFDTIALAGSYTGALSRTLDTWTGNVGGQDWTFEQTTGLLSVVPEPSTWLLLALGGTFVMVVRRRRA